MSMPSAADSEAPVDGVPVIREAFRRTVRLVTTARLRDAVLKALVDDAELDALAEIEGATSARLIAEQRGVAGIPSRELVHGVPHAAFVNASFVYARPREPNRFNGPERGAWYAALAVETCIAEVAFHMGEFLARAGLREASVDYAEMFASMAGEFADLRGTAGHPSLDPDTRIGYRAGNALAAKVLARGLNGIIYPSVRHEGGVCIAALWPHAVQSVAQGAVYRLAWSGGPAPNVMRVTE
jgi:hypothetical protein